MRKRLYLIGLGPGDPELLTLKALRLIQTLPVLFYPKEEGRPSLALSIAEPHIPKGKRLEALPLFTGKDKAERERARRAAAGRIREVLVEVGEGGYLVLGDPGLYGSPYNLLPHLEGLEVEVVPGLSAHQLAAARSHRPLAMGDGGFAVLSGLALLRQGVDLKALQGFQSLFIYKAKDPQALARLFPNREAWVYRRLGFSGEASGEVLPLEEVQEWDYWTLLGLW